MSTLAVEAIPVELRERRQWVVFRFEPNPGKPKPRKVPYRVDAPTRRAASDDPASWATFEEAAAIVASGQADAIGYCFAADDPFVGVDLDDKFSEEERAAIVRELESYTERSVSGEGEHVIVRASLNGHGRNRSGGFEVYERERFFLVTGAHVAGTPTTIEPRQAQLEQVLARFLPKREAIASDTACAVTPVDLDDRDLLDRALGAANGSDFEALWKGEWENRYSSQSEADLAFSSMLAFWTGRDAARIDSIFRASGLYREKWERADYRNSTIDKAIAGTTDTYHPPRAEQVATTVASPEDEVRNAVTNLGAPADLRYFHLTDGGNAQRLVVRHGADLRYVYPWESWLVWNGQRWQRDDTGEPASRMKETMRAFLDEVRAVDDDGLRKKLIKHALDSESAARIRAALWSARSEAGIPVLPEHLDAHPMLLNVGNGTVDLATGTLHPHDRAQLATKIASVDYNPDAAAPKWEAFLERVLPDPDLRAFVQRYVGYSLTGLTTEQVIAILYGPGANGKSVFVETIRAALGDYGQQAPAETFLERRDTIPNDVARLRGARFVAATETAEGRRLNEALVKRMTGGDTMVARFMRGEWFEFPATFKVVLATNHRPEIRGTDEAIWRRIRLVPFTVTIPPAERDQTLGAQLRDELPGILAWAVAGCLDWQRDGLGSAEAVTAATTAYRGDMDLLGDFLDECCDLSPDAQCRAADLYACFTGWADRNGTPKTDRLSQQAFGRRLSERGLVQHRTKSARLWLGIQVASGEEGDG
jgi:putative DNA primase/helicase